MRGLFVVVAVVVVVVRSGVVFGVCGVFSVVVVFGVGVVFRVVEGRTDGKLRESTVTTSISSSARKKKRIEIKEN